MTDAPYIFLNKFAGRFSIEDHAISAMVDNQNRIQSLNALFDVPGVPGVQAAAVSSANKWEMLATTSSISPPRMDHTSVYHREMNDVNSTVSSEGIYVFGGKCEQGLLNDTWILRKNQSTEEWSWSSLTTTVDSRTVGSPAFVTPRFGHSTSLTELRHGDTNETSPFMVVYGGHDGFVP